MSDLLTIQVPAYEFQFNLVVYPLPATTVKTVSNPFYYRFCNKFLVFKGKSGFYILKNNAVHAKPTGGVHWIEFMPDHVYCFLPSSAADAGKVEVHRQMPDWVKGFLFCMEIKENIKEVLLYLFEVNLKFLNLRLFSHVRKKGCANLLTMQNRQQVIRYLMQQFFNDFP